MIASASRVSIRVRAERVKPVAVLVVAGGVLLLGVGGDQRRVDIDRQPLGRTSKLPEPLARAARARSGPRRASRASERSSGPSETRSSQTPPPRTALLLADRTEVSDALAAVGEHHREITDHPARVMATTPLLDRPQPDRQRPREPDRVGDLAQQRAPACETSPAPSDVTSTVTHRPSRITRKVNPQARDSGLQQSQESLLCRTFPRPRSPRGRGSYCAIRARGRGTSDRRFRARVRRTLPSRLRRR